MFYFAMDIYNRTSHCTHAWFVCLRMIGSCVGSSVLIFALQSRASWSRFLKANLVCVILPVSTYLGSESGDGSRLGLHVVYGMYVSIGVTQVCALGRRVGLAKPYFF